jgi:hypothetical protein
MKPVAALIYGQDNGAYMVGSCDTRLPGIPNEVFCSQCGWKKDWTFVRDDFRLGQKRMDVSSTYDGMTIVSSRARKALCDIGIGADQMRELPGEPDFYALLPTDEVPFDAERRRTRFSDQCSACGLFGSVAGATPPFFKDLPQESVWIARTDLLFGSHNEHHPLIVASARVAAALLDANLTGLDLKTIMAEQVGDG